MKFSLKAVRRDKVTGYSLNTASVANISSLLFLLLSWTKLPPEVPLFYSRPWGEEQLVSPLFLWFLPGSSLIVIWINLFLASYFATDKLIVRMLMVAVGLYSLLAAIIVFRIIILIS